MFVITLKTHDFGNIKNIWTWHNTQRIYHSGGGGEQEGELFYKLDIGMDAEWSDSEHGCFMQLGVSLPETSGSL